MTNRRSILALALVFATGSPLLAEELLPPDRPVAAAIDHYVDLLLKADQIEPAATVDDAALLRRLTLDLAGRIPTLAETRAYVESDRADKRERLVDRLLASPDHAFHLRNHLDETLLASKKNDNEWRAYLLKAVRENRTWDRMFSEMMIGREDNAQEKPALAFLKARAASIDDLTVDTSSLFFGVNVSCAKCHDHPLVEDWKQDHFFGMRSFFSRTYLTKKKTLAEKYSGSVKFKTVEGTEKQARFMFLTGAVVDEPLVARTADQRKQEENEVKRQMKDAKAPPPKPPAFSPRAELVKLALSPSSSAYFARSITNRTWARLLGRGIVDPLDQMHSGNPASHPELLDWLTRDLVEHQYALRRLIRGIVLSRTYARSSRWEQSRGEPPSADYFAVAAVRALTPRQYALSLLVATAAPGSLPGPDKPDDWGGRREQLEKASQKLVGEIELPGDNFQVSVDEALLFSNGQRVQDEYLGDGKDRLVGVLKEQADAGRLVDTAFRVVLSRPAADDERRAFEEYLSSRAEKDRLGAIRQIVWALITSSELRFNH